MSGGGGGPDLGTVAGGLVGGPVGALVGNVAGGGDGFGAVPFLNDVRDTVTGKKQADAQEAIARAQEEEQRRTRAAALAAAEPSPQEMAQLMNSISLNEQDVKRKQKLIDSSDPALIEAGTQALKLLQGQDAATLDPIRRQREKERAKLTQKLQAQLGPGYETSTAGIQALTAFDEATNNALAGAQQQSLAQLLGVAQNTSGNYGMQNNIANSGTIASLFGNQSSRRVAAINGSPITAAGSQFVGDLSQARTMAGLVNTGINAGAAYLTGGASAAVPGGVAGAAGGGGGGMASPTSGGYAGGGSQSYLGNYNFNY